MVFLLLHVSCFSAPVCLMNVAIEIVIFKSLSKHDGRKSRAICRIYPYEKNARVVLPLTWWINDKR